MNQEQPKSTLFDAVRMHKELRFPAVAANYQEPVALVRSEGEYVWVNKGNKLLSCFDGMLNVSAGYANAH